jgi:hypothetical protein
MILPKGTEKIKGGKRIRGGAKGEVKLRLSPLSPLPGLFSDPRQSGIAAPVARLKKAKKLLRKLSVMVILLL